MMNQAIQNRHEALRKTEVNTSFQEPSTASRSMRAAWKTLSQLRMGGQADEAASAYRPEEIKLALDAVVALADEPESSPVQSVEFARALMGQYRARDFVDVELFAASLASVFQHYQRSLCRLCVDPMVGLPSEVKFPPSVQEVKEWLDREQGRLGYYLWRVTQIREAQMGGSKMVKRLNPSGVDHSNKEGW